MVRRPSARRGADVALISAHPVERPRALRPTRTGASVSSRPNHRARRSQRASPPQRWRRRTDPPVMTSLVYGPRVSREQAHARADAEGDCGLSATTRPVIGDASPRWRVAGSCRPHLWPRRPRLCRSSRSTRPDAGLACRTRRRSGRVSGCTADELQRPAASAGGTRSPQFTESRRRAPSGRAPPTASRSQDGTPRSIAGRPPAASGTLRACPTRPPAAARLRPAPSSRRSGTTTSSSRSPALRPSSASTCTSSTRSPARRRSRASAGAA